MRSVLMDWLVQVHRRFQLLPETLFLSVNYVDRFLSCKIVSLGKLQLVGATAIFVAAKYEEINCPSVQDIIFMVDGGYTVDEILKAERFMLTMLQFELGWPGPMSFLRRMSKADFYDLETRTLAKYFLEVIIMDERFVGCAPSFTAAGAHCLSRFMLGKGDWVSRFAIYFAERPLTPPQTESWPRLLLQLHVLPDSTAHHRDPRLLRESPETPRRCLREGRGQEVQARLAFRRSGDSPRLRVATRVSRDRNRARFGLEAEVSLVSGSVQNRDCSSMSFS